MAMTRSFCSLFVVVLLGATGPAAAQTLKGKKKSTAPKIDLGLPKFTDLPTGEDMKVKKEAPAQQARKSQADASWAVVRVVHGRGFIRTPEGAKASAPFPFVPTSDKPLMTEKFTTIVRLKSAEMKSTSIEVAVLDPRGDTIMEAKGQVLFRGTDEAEWQVDWDASGIRTRGDFQVLIRVAGQPLGTFPLKVGE